MCGCLFIYLKKNCRVKFVIQNLLENLLINIWFKRITLLFTQIDAVRCQSNPTLSAVYYAIVFYVNGMGGNKLAYLPFIYLSENPFWKGSVIVLGRIKAFMSHTTELIHECLPGETFVFYSLNPLDYSISFVYVI